MLKGGAIICLPIVVVFISLLLCGQCWLAYRNHGDFLGAVRYPVCREQVTSLFQFFTESESNIAELDEVELRSNLQREINSYNLQFSVHGLTFQPPPTICGTFFFSEGCLVYMFRIRIVNLLLQHIWHNLGSSCPFGHHP